ncbi:MAG: hypothetical protein QN189_12745 [Armatimonadota bacterium]|nr:hypothetical protein [Armatimonadota bacterium]
MSWRVAVLLTAALTAFVLGITVALASRLGASAGSSEQKASIGYGEATVPWKVVLEREQRYRERLEEAHARLNWAYSQIRTLQGKLAALAAQAPRYTQGIQGAPTADLKWSKEWETQKDHEHEKEEWEDD